MSNRIADRVVIITGASSGIGKATALALAGEGAKLTLVARRGDVLEQVRREIHGTGSVECLALDLTRRSDIEVMIRRTREVFGRIDVLINNAAFGFYGPVEAIPPAVLDEIFALNFQAPLIASQLAIPIMRAQKRGHIINISSVAGKRGLPLSSIYCATKFALDGLSQSMRLELKGDGIDVSLINPGATATDFFSQVRRVGVSGRFKPAGKIQSAETVARAIVRCVRDPKIEVYPYGISRLLVWANALAPSMVDRIMVPYLRDRIRSRTT